MSCSTFLWMFCLCTLHPETFYWGQPENHGRDMSLLWNRLSPPPWCGSRFPIRDFPRYGGRIMRIFIGRFAATWFTGVQHSVCLPKWAAVQTVSICKPTRPFCLPAGPRLSLPEEWRGVRDEALSELSGIKGCIFVHAGGFIGGNKTQEGALEMTRRTLQAAARSPANGGSWRFREDTFCSRDPSLERMARIQMFICYFATCLSRLFGANVVLFCRAGAGMLCKWEPNNLGLLPKIFAVISNTGELWIIILAHVFSFSIVLVLVSIKACLD